MEPRIQYAKTTDGVSIAFWTLGQGLPFVFTPASVSHIQLEWQIPTTRGAYERVAERRMLVRYDPRGSGLSEREVSDFSLDAQLLDLEAVVARLRLERFSLMGYQDSGPTAIAYAARHPQRVSHLLLWSTGARGIDLMNVSSSRGRAIAELSKLDWGLFVDTLVHEYLGRSEGEQAPRVAKYFREAVTRDSYARATGAKLLFDVNALLPDVRSPTLVLHPKYASYPMDVARGLASRIPDARLAIVEGTPAALFLGDEALLAAIDEFLSEGEEAEAAAELPEGMAVLLFADIAGSTALTEQFGDAAFRAKARELDTSLRAVIRECSGTPVEGKVLGDGVLAVFTSARQAIDCALRCGAAGEPLGLRLHLGIHAGDVIREGNNVYGGAVNIAARIAAASQPGEVLVSDVLRGLARTSAGVTFDDRGEHELKGVGEPQRLFAVRGGG
jgi:class 3 adenylate cyclase